MKYLKLITSIFLSAILFVAFSGQSALIAGKVNSSSVSGSPTASVGDGSFSYKIEGKVFSGNSADKHFNRAFKHPGNVVHFILTNLDPTLKTAQPQFSFSIAGNGTTVIGKDDMERFSSGNNVKYFADFSIPGGGIGEIPNYEFYSSITVIITANSSHLTGTFSGTLLNPNTKKVVQLTDGSFDLPFSATSK